MIRALAAKGNGWLYVDVFTPMLDTNGQPIASLFIIGGLHLTRDGYAIWRDKIAPVLR